MAVAGVDVGALGQKQLDALKLALLDGEMSEERERQGGGGVGVLADWGFSSNCTPLMYLHVNTIHAVLPSIIGW